MKKRIIWSALILSVVGLLGFFSPDIYWAIIGAAGGEAFYDGRPTSYWRDIVKEDCDQRKLAAAAPDWVPPPPAFPGAPTPTRTWQEHFKGWKEKWLGHKAEAWDSLVKDQNALPIWRQLLQDEFPDVRGKAFDVVLSHEHDSDLPSLFGFLATDDEKTMQFRLLAAVGVYKQTAAPFFHSQLADKDARIRRAALLGLIEFYNLGENSVGEHEIVALLTDLTGDPDRNLRAEAILWLSRFGERAHSAVPRLTEASRNDPSEEIRQKAANAIDAIQRSK